MRNPSVVPRRIGGYSLIEMMTALLLLSILIGMAAPSLSGYLARQQIRRALDRVAADLTYARLSAVREGRQVRVRFAGGGTVYSLVAGAGAPDSLVLRTVDLAVDYPAVSFSGDTRAALRYGTRGLLAGPGAGEQGFVKLVGRGARDSLLVAPTGRVYRGR